MDMRRITAKWAPSAKRVAAILVLWAETAAVAGACAQLANEKPHQHYGNYSRLPVR
jgi:hypothetical protein